MLKTRKMKPPVREKIEQLVSELVETPVEDVYERDAKTGVLIRVGHTPGGYDVVTRPTGKMVESFETTEDGKAPLVHEGSLKQVDLTCHDCGSLLKPANDRNFYYLLCSRLNERRHEQFQRIEQRPFIGDDGAQKVATVLVTWDVPSQDPYENCVLECDNEPHEEPA